MEQTMGKILCMVGVAIIIYMLFMTYKTNQILQKRLNTKKGD